MKITSNTTTEEILKKKEQREELKQREQLQKKARSVDIKGLSNGDDGSYNNCYINAFAQFMYRFLLVIFDEEYDLVKFKKEKSNIGKVLDKIDTIESSVRLGYSVNDFIRNFLNGYSGKYLKNGHIISGYDKNEQHCVNELFRDFLNILVSELENKTYVTKNRKDCYRKISYYQRLFAIRNVGVLRNIYGGFSVYNEYDGLLQEDIDGETRNVEPPTPLESYPEKVYTRSYGDIAFFKMVTSKTKVPLVMYLDNTWTEKKEKYQVSSLLIYHGNTLEGFAGHWTTVRYHNKRYWHCDDSRLSKLTTSEINNVLKNKESKIRIVQYMIAKKLD